MTRNIYALLVGIDEYKSPIPPLKGCVNDIMAIKGYLEQRVSSEGYQLNIRTLLNQDATRQAIIDGFEQHLTQATSEDVAFFYYAGHGAQENAPKEFLAFEPDGMDETIVCYDSRRNGAWDLADKELAKLIAKVAQKNPHITIIMDCCHSGSGSRDLEVETATRMAPKDDRQRPLDSFIFSPQDADIIAPASSRSLELNSGGFAVSTGKHIFLSACLNNELAKEYNGDGQPRGAFSFFLVDTLKKANGNLSYRDLIKRAKALVKSKVKEQSPQLEAVGSSDLDELFLGGAIGERTPYFTVSYHREYGWIMDGGAATGVSQGMGDETTNLALFPFEVSATQLQDAKFAIAKAKVVEVLPQLSKVEISGVSNLSLDMTFKAIVTSLPLPPKGVIISGEPQGVELARKAIETSNNNQPSLYLRSVETIEKAEFELLAKDDKYIITRPADGRALVENLDGYNQSTAFQAIQRLEHITRWMNIVELASPATSSIAPNAIELSVYQNGQALQGTEIRIQYEQQNGQWKRPAIKIRLKNNSDKRLYCALLDLTERYAVQSGFFEGGGIWLNAGEEAWALDGREIKPEVKDKYWQQGVTEAKDILKLIVSTAEFDAGLLELKELDSASVRDVKHPRRGNGTLNSLMNRIPSRDILGSDEEEVYDDWVTTQIAFTTVRPQPTTPVPKGEETVPLANGVQLQGHPELNAKVRLLNANESATTGGTRSLGTNTLPPILRGREGVTSFKFNTATRGLEPELNVLQISDIEDPSVVTPSNPLKLVVDTTLSDNEELLAFTHDGEFYLPVGHTQTTPNGKTEIVLDRLIENNPNPDESTRSLQSAVSIYFQKVVTQKFGAQYDYPRLALANVSVDRKVNYTNNLQQIQAEVAKAQRVAVYIHGIIGDTESIVPSIHLAKVQIDGQEKSLADLYDVVLTFDYENLNTPIEENAKLLKERLQAVGLTENHGKQLHIIAHSMGGLVSRWFIEREGGNQIAQHLIMLGTPNGGSPWPKVQDMAMTALTLGLNGLSTITWPVPVLGMLLKVINKRAEVNLNNMQVCLEQMLPNSDFLKNLAESPDPGIPYTIIAGNTSIAPAALTPGTEESNRVQRLMQKLFSKAIALPFFGQTNDIAATVVSITNVNMNRQHQPQIQEVGCDHLVYFSDPIGLTALSQAVLHAFNHTEATTTSQDKVKNLTNDVTLNSNNTSDDSSSNSSIWTTSGIMGLLGALFVSGFLMAHQGSNIKVDNQNTPRNSQVK